MPIRNPSAELLEAIRKDGLCKVTGIFAQWGYSDKEEPKLFILAKDEKLPKGWSESPVKADESPKAEPEA